MGNHQPAKVVRPGGGKRVAALGELHTFLAEGEDTAKSYALWEATVPPGGGPPPHVHTRENEGFYVLEGEITFTADGERTVAGPGTFLNIPPGVVHRFRNEGEAAARMLLIVAPAGLEKMSAEMGRVVTGPDARPTPPSPGERARALAIPEKYGITILDEA